MPGKEEEGSPPRNDTQRTFVSILSPFPNQPGEQLARRGLCDPLAQGCGGSTGAQITGFFNLPNKNSSSSGIQKYTLTVTIPTVTLSSYN